MISRTPLSSSNESNSASLKFLNTKTAWTLFSYIFTIHLSRKTRHHDLQFADNQLNPSNRPSPVVAHDGCTYQFLSRMRVKPNFSWTSWGFIAARTNNVSSQRVYIKLSLKKDKRNIKPECPTADHLKSLTVDTSVLEVQGPRILKPVNLKAPTFLPLSNWPIFVIKRFRNLEVV